MSSLPTNSSRGIVIVGGGVSGLSIAVRLSQSGLPVTLLEASDLGRAASSKNQGWLYSGAWFAPRQQDLAHYCYQSLRQTLAFCPDCLEAGTSAMIYILSSDKTNPANWTDAWMAAGIPFDEIPGNVAVEETGIPHSIVKRAFRLPDRAIRPSVLLERLIAVAEYQGVDIRTRSSVTSLLKSGDQIQGVLTSRGEAIKAGLVILAANVGGSDLWPASSRNGSIAGLQPEFTRVTLKTHCLTVRPSLAAVPFCVVDLEGLNHIPHQLASVFGTSRWIPVSDGKDQEALESEIDRLRNLVSQLYPRLRIEEYDAAGWAGTTMQAMHFDQVEPGLAPLPTVIDHFYEPPYVSNLLSVFPGRGSLWPQLAEITKAAVMEKLGAKVSDTAKPEWFVDSLIDRS
jgi:glycine/D-amino acid oxidase-like deaminating enzyme